MLLSIKSSTWKITDFGLTAEGTARTALATQYARGTISYRAPELHKGIASMKSDIWALGCILYELVFGCKAFLDDWSVFQYFTSKQRLDFPTLGYPMDKRLNLYISQFLHNILEIDWWRRPTAPEILQAINSLSEEATQVYVLSVEPDSFRQQLHLHYDSGSWKAVLWKQCW